VHLPGCVAHFLGGLGKDERLTAGLALKRVAQDGSDPSPARGDLRGASLLSLITGRREYAHAQLVFESQVWQLLGPEGVSPDALVEMQEALCWELAFGCAYGPKGADPNGPGVARTRNSRLPWKAIPMVLGPLGSLRWRALEPRAFTDAIRLLAARPSWPALSLLCVLLLRMGDSEARTELVLVRAAIVTCMDWLGARPHVDPRAAAVFRHLVRRRILSATRSLEHSAPVLAWANEQLGDLDRACVTDRDRRWYARQVDALACAASAAPGPGADLLGWRFVGPIESDPGADAVRRAIEDDEHAYRLRKAQRDETPA